MPINEGTRVFYNEGTFREYMTPVGYTGLNCLLLLQRTDRRLHRVENIAGFDEFLHARVIRI